MKIRKKEFLEENVYQASLERIRHIYDSFDEVQVSFSGGKDSTAVLNVTLEVARERNRLPLKVLFFDEEAIHPPTIEYVERVRQSPEIDMDWYCLEIKHRNACSNEEPWWYNWEKGKEDIWVRELPENVITEHPKFKKGMTVPNFVGLTNDKSKGRVAQLTGVRSQESMRRYRIIAMKSEEVYIAGRAEPGTNSYTCHPIYDWSSEDVWLGVHKFGWDYNKTYDIMNQTKHYQKYLVQRVCPPFGEEPLRGLWIYAECFPEMWHKMLSRVKGVGTAWRYANTSLFSRAEKPEGLEWREYINVILDSYANPYKNQVKKVMNSVISRHRKRSTMKIPEDSAHPISGVSWKFICRVALRGDFKGRVYQMLPDQAKNACDKLGITQEEAEKQYK